MGISAISSTSTSGTTSTTTSVAVLEKQIQALQKQLTTELQSADDAKTKEVKMQQIEAQIEALNAQVTQIEAQAAKAQDAQQSSQSPSGMPASASSGYTVDTQA